MRAQSLDQREKGGGDGGVGESGGCGAGGVAVEEDLYGQGAG